MELLGNIRTFNIGQFVVTVDAMQDDDTDMSFDEDGSIQAGIDSGQYVCFAVRAQVIHDDLGVIATDWLGGCIYESFDAFMDHRACGIQNREREAKGQSGRCGSYFVDMIHTVCAEARQHIINTHNIKIRTVK